MTTFKLISKYEDKHIFENEHFATSHVSFDSASYLASINCIHRDRFQCDNARRHVFAVLSKDISTFLLNVFVSQQLKENKIWVVVR